MKKLVVICFFIVSIAEIGNSETNFYYDQLVKTREDYGYVCDDRYKWPYEWILYYDFSAPASDVEIAPLSGDPMTATAMPMRAEECPVDDDGDGLMEIAFSMSFNSLYDLGVWTAIIDTGLWVDPYCCWPDGRGECGFLCDLRASDCLTDIERATIFITVYNDPPQAIPDHSPAPQWNRTVQLDANSDDPDGGSLSHTWRITERPPHSTATLSSATSETASITFSSDRDIGDWRFEVDVDDDEGERKTFSESFTVPNEVPTILIDGATTINALDTVSLTAVNVGATSPGEDVDGGALTFLWEVLQAAAGACVSVGQTWTTRTISFPTTEHDITTIDGTDGVVFRFRVTATDNEGASDEETVDVRVNNLPPRIHLIGNPEIDVDDELLVRTDILTDDDGGDLTFSWDVIQTPNSSSYRPQLDFRTTQEFSIFTCADDAGTWIVRVNATDNEGQTVTSEDYVVLVDGMPQAVVNGPEMIGSLSFPLVLDGSESEDPDSRCDPPDYCHTSLEPPVGSISEGIVQYVWHLIDFPSEYDDEYYPGRVDEVFGISGTSHSISLDFGSIKPGDWQFQLEVFDAEGNSDYSDFEVTVVDEEGAPYAYLSPPVSHLTNLTGLVTSDLNVSGANSFDLDNALLGEVLGPGVGIEEYRWNYLSVPPGCASRPALPEAGMTSSFDLFGSGEVVSAAALGTYRIDLTVSDDDSRQKSASGQTSVTLYNCPSHLCIISPTASNPAFVEFSDNTDIIIEYYLNSLIYDDAAFAAGLIATVAIFHESDLLTPVFSDYDFNVLGTNKGSVLAFHWDGYTTNHGRPQPGMYSIQISLLDHQYRTTLYTAFEANAIWIEVVEPIIANTSTRYIDFDDLSTGSDQVNIEYSISGASPDELVWRVFDASSTDIIERAVVAPFTSPITWDGIDRTGTRIPPGLYHVELEALRGARSLGKSGLHDFYVYRFDIDFPGGVVANTAPGMRIMANTDDDNMNNQSDSTEACTVEDDLVRFNFSIEPPDLPGSLTLTGTNDTHFRVWNDSVKSTQIPVPFTTVIPAGTPPDSVFIEGRQVGTSTLSLSFRTHDGIDLNRKEAVVTFYEIKVMADTNNTHAIDAADEQRYFTGIANWEHGYDAAFNVLNNADPHNFIEQDGSRFYIVVNDPSANSAPGAIQQVSMQIGVMRDDTTVVDSVSDFNLTETGVNTGSFVSPSHILTSIDIQVANDPDADDEFAAHDGSSGIVFDDAADDRTHQADLNSIVQLSYMPVGSTQAKRLSVPVWPRNPDFRKRIDIAVHVYYEPYTDNGLDGVPGTGDVGEGDLHFSFTDANGNGKHDAGESSEPYIDFSHGGAALLSGSAAGVADGRGLVASDSVVEAQIQRSDIGWAQAGIWLNQISIVRENAPLSGGVDILLDGMTSIGGGGADDEVIYNANSGVMTNDVLKVFFTGNVDGSNAIQYRPGFAPFVHGEHVFVLMSADLPFYNRTLAHELGHLLTNTPHSPANQTEFYPLGGLFDDLAINTYRRLLPTTIDQARTVRPAGNLNAIGNQLLK